MTRIQLASDASVIKQAVNDGKRVLTDEGHEVIRTPDGRYFIGSGGMLIGLTWMDGKTLNAKEFYEVQS